MLENKKEHIKKLNSKLEVALSDEESMSGDLLELSLKIISQQNKLINSLEKEIYLVKGLHKNLCKEIIKTYEKVK